MENNVYHADFDTTLQRYSLLSPDVLKIKLKYRLLFDSTILLPEDQVIDHAFYRELFQEHDFRKFIEKESKDGKSPIVVGLRKGCNTLLEVVDDARNDPWHSSSMPEINKLFLNKTIGNIHDFISEASKIYPIEISRILKTEEFLASNKNCVIEFQRDNKNYNKLVRDAVKNFPEEIMSENFENFKDEFDSEMDEKGEENSRSELVRISESLAQKQKIKFEEKTTLQYICQDIPYNINTLQGAVSSVIIGNNPFLHSMMNPNPLTETSLLNAYKKFEVDKNGMDLNKLPNLNRLSFNDIAEIRADKEFQSTLKDLEYVGERNRENRLKEHEKFIVEKLSHMGKITTDKSKIVQTFETIEKSNVPIITTGIGGIWTILQGVLNASEQLGLPITVLGSSLLAYRSMSRFTTYLDNKNKKNNMISELKLLRN